MISVIITAKKEPVTVAKALKSIVRPFYSGIPEDFEIIQVSPDEETLESGKETIQNEKWAEKKFLQIKDPDRGKPHALNLAFQKVKGEIIILTDGDVYFEKNAVAQLLIDFHDPNVGGVTGRPVSQDSKNYMMGYIGHLLADAAHHKRMINLKKIDSGKSSIFVSKSDFFPMSGYIMAIRNIGLELPNDVLVDDAYLSYIFHNKGMKIAYKPEAIAYVKYPKTVSDYMKQKKRSLGGYIQLWKYGIVNSSNKSRSFWQEVQYFWFPIFYAKKLKEYFWSCLFYPIRLYTWIAIWIERKILHKDFNKTWARVESTK
jgi:cellulose synthase/poly-beta-1,6-N-acetylglucosamine synthase-like glycosyltransferase